LGPKSPLSSGPLLVATLVPMTAVGSIEFVSANYRATSR
jgi:hypothetical protein